MALGVALPAIVIWSIGIPSYAFILMHKHKNELNLVKVKTRYGFLYNGYKLHSFYWEVVIMYRKILFIFISVFLATAGETI